jgi:hypothetical protein
MLPQKREGAMNRIFLTGLAGLALVAAAASGQAQTLTGQQNYSVRTMSFDSWCQQLQRLPVDRCKQRRADDLKAFNDYREVIERYELQYLRQAQKDRDFNNHSRDFNTTVLDRAIGIR